MWYTERMATIATITQEGAFDATVRRQVNDNFSALNLAAVQGVGTGYELARGTLTPDAASKTVATGLATVVAAVASLKGAPTINHTMVAADIGDQAGSPPAGSILIKSYKPTAANDTTPTAATANWVAVDWIAVGT